MAVEQAFVDLRGFENFAAIKLVGGQQVCGLRAPRGVKVALYDLMENLRVGRLLVFSQLTLGETSILQLVGVPPLGIHLANQAVRLAARGDKRSPFLAVRPFALDLNKDVFLAIQNRLQETHRRSEERRVGKERSTRWL